MALERELNNDYIVKNIVLFRKLEDRTYLYSSSTFDTNEFCIYYKNLPSEIDHEDLKMIYNNLCRFKATEEELEAHKQEVRNSRGYN